MPQTPLKLGTLTIAATLAAGAASAQDVCGRGGAVWIGGSPEASDISTADGFLEEMALVMGGNEYIAAFSLSADTSVRVEAEGRGAADTVIELLDGSGNFVLMDDDSGGNGASRAETDLAAGEYCLAVRSYDGGPMTAFVRVGREEHQALTQGVMDAGASVAEGSCDDGLPLEGLGASASGSANDTPYYRFTLTEPAPISVLAQNESADPVVTLYDMGGEFLGENDDYLGLDSQLDMTDPLPAGEYCVHVTALSDSTLPITVTVRAYDPEQALLDLYASGEAAPPMDGSVEITDLGVLETRLRKDLNVGTEVEWHMVEVLDPSMILIEAAGVGGGDPWLVVYDDFGRQIGMNDDHGDGLDSQIAARVQPGIYLIGVRQYQEGSGIIRLGLERYVRATK